MATLEDCLVLTANIAQGLLDLLDHLRGEDL
jgi:hypothetical protein